MNSNNSVPIPTFNNEKDSKVYIFPMCEVMKDKHGFVPVQFLKEQVTLLNNPAIEKAARQVKDLIGSSIFKGKLEACVYVNPNTRLVKVRAVCKNTHSATNYAWAYRTLYREFTKAARVEPTQY